MGSKIINIIIALMICITGIIVTYMYCESNRYDINVREQGIYELDSKTGRVWCIRRRLFKKVLINESKEPVYQEPKIIPTEEMSKVNAKAYLSDNKFFCNFHNNTDWSISEIILSITVKDKNIDKEILSRRYRLLDVCDPFSSSEKRIDLDFTIEKDQSWTWFIMQAKGINKNILEKTVDK